MRSAFLLVTVLFAVACAGAPSSEPADAATSSSCAAPKTDCSGACVDLSSDGAHCGSCTTACSGGRQCVSGKCTLVCGQGQALCAETCATLATDANNCGACFNACGTGRTCSAGSCIAACTGGQIACNGACVNPKTDKANCGTCGHACPGSQVCSNGSCSSTCTGALADCSGVCLDLMTDDAHCGTCTNACGAGKTCVAGNCEPNCGPGEKRCGGDCIDVTSDPSNCGDCNKGCALANADPVCVGGVCRASSCRQGFGNCDGVDSSGCEVNLNSDPAHCGSCMNACGSGAPSCASGMCSSAVAIDTHNFKGYTEYPLDNDLCKCCAPTTTKEMADQFCILAGYASSVSWVTQNIVGTNCYCWGGCSGNKWISNCCSGQTSRPLVTSITCQ